MKRTITVSFLAAIILLTGFFAAVNARAAEDTDPAPDESACAAESEPAVSDRFTLSGGWQYSQDPAVTDEILEVFCKATEALCGVEYTPVAFLGSQIVAGTNYCILCQADASTLELRNGSQTYVLMYIYEDLSGNAEILNITDLDITAYIN